MQQDPVVVRTASAKRALRKYQDAEDRGDKSEVDRWGQIWTDLLKASAQDRANVECGRRAETSQRRQVFQARAGRFSERFARTAIGLACKIERGEMSPLIVRELRALMPAALCHGCETLDNSPAEALAHAIDWCARFVNVIEFPRRSTGTIDVSRSEMGMLKISVRAPLSITNKMLAAMRGGTELQMNIQEGGLVSIEGQFPASVAAKVLAKARETRRLNWSLSWRGSVATLARLSGTHRPKLVLTE